MEVKVDNNNSIMKQVIAGIAVSLGVSAVSHTAQIVKTLSTSTIDVGEWDNAYNNVNKMLYKLSPETYIKHRAPTTNKDFYELSEDISYFIPLKNKNYIKVETYRNKSEKTFYPEHRLRVKFFGKEKHLYREQFLRDALKLTDDKHIRVVYMNEHEMSCDVIPHSFDNIVLNPSVRDNIVNGLINLNNSKEWYNNHQLIHKIGVFLYGKA